MPSSETDQKFNTPREFLDMNATLCVKMSLKARYGKGQNYTSKKRRLNLQKRSNRNRYFVGTVVITTSILMKIQTVFKAFSQSTVYFYETGYNQSAISTGIRILYGERCTLFTMDSD
jgi:hypothetical protein